MKRKIVRRLGSLVLASAMLSCISPSVGFATEDENISTKEVQNLAHLYYDTMIPTDPNSDETQGSTLNVELQNQYNSTNGEVSTNATTQLPSSVDLSTSKFFPKIGNQGQVGSCAAFATTYYQFTYEANKLRGIQTTSSNTYSPSWPYYYLTTTDTSDNPTGNGTNSSFVRDFLKLHGALTLADNPYSTTYDPTHPLPTDVDAMCEALGTRLESSQYNYIRGYDGEKTIPNITGPKDSDLNTIKSLLNSGKVLNVGVCYNFDYAIFNNQLINFRSSYKAARGHALTVVGYNDSIYYDVNQNGIIENGEKGAFKIANSWGTSHGNAGYEWVLYDALNCTSSISGSWENKYSGTRIPAFSGTVTATSNNFYYIKVAEFDVNFVAELNFTNAIKDNIIIQLQKTRNGTISSCIYPSSPEGNTPSTFTLVIDYVDLEENLDSDSGACWGFNLTGTQKTVSSAKLLDNRGNKITQMSKIGSTSRYIAMPYMILGDINYDGSISNADFALVNQYLAGYDNLSNIQIYLADYNEDGEVNNKDTAAILQYINALS